MQAGEPWDRATLGSCEDRKPAHVVGWPYVGANCDPDKPETNKQHVLKSLMQLQGAPKSIPWEPDTLPRCKDYRPAHTVAYPYVGANCKVWHPQPPEESKDSATA